MKRYICAILLFAPFNAAADPLFRNSVVSNDLEFITTSDQSSFYCLQYFGTSTREMPDNRSEELVADGVYNFEAWFKDGTVIDIWAHPSIGNQMVAKTVVQKITGPLGRLPSFMRAKIDHVVIHSGDEAAFAEDAGRFFVLYSENIAKRIQTHDLEETVFHEAVHASLDIPLAQSSDWIAAQIADDDFVTHYAASSPGREDLAETALFAYAYYQHQSRLPKSVQLRLEEVIPNRLGFFAAFFGADRHMQRVVSSLEPCLN